MHSYHPCLPRSWAHVWTAPVCELPAPTICVSHCQPCSKLVGRRDHQRGEYLPPLPSLKIQLLIHVSGLWRHSCVHGSHTSGCPSAWYPGLFTACRARGRLLSETGVQGKEAWPTSLEKGKKEMWDDIREEPEGDEGWCQRGSSDEDCWRIHEGADRLVGNVRIC